MVCRLRESVVAETVEPISLPAICVGVPGWALGIMEGDEVLRLSAPAGAPCRLPGVRKVAAIVRLWDAAYLQNGEEGRKRVNPNGTSCLLPKFGIGVVQSL